MSLKAMPLLFLNMGGEMLYILDQRLRAQEIESGKSERVLDDILGLMCTGRFIEELFRPQPLYSAHGLRTIFYRLAHSSIMRLNKPSMDKLYDLMVMVFKYQLEQCAQPQQLVMITLNHLDQMARFATAPRVKRQVDATYDLFVQSFGGVSAGEMQDIRYEILNFFLDYRVKVSIFLKEKLQNANGLFVIDVSGPLPEGVAKPGNIVSFDEHGEINGSSCYPCMEALSEPLKPASLARDGYRATHLGTNIYQSREGEVVSVAPRTAAQPSKTAPAAGPTPAPAPDAAEALQLLAQLIGHTTKKCEFRLTLPGTTSTAGAGDVSADEEAAGEAVVATRGRSHHLERVLQDMTLDEAAGDQPDLLHMMDAIAE